MKKKVVCVTGASGFIGSCLVQLLLNRGYTVHATVQNLSILLFFPQFFLIISSICKFCKIQILLFNSIILINVFLDFLFFYFISFEVADLDIISNIFKMSKSKLITKLMLSKKIAILMFTI